MRKFVAILVGIAILALANWSVYQRERLLSNGQVVLLELAPVDPRSLMQGDYMALRFKLAGEVFGRGPVKESADGRIVVSVGDHGVGSFVRHDAGEPLAPGEARMRYRIRENRVKFATNAYFFQEGSASAYARARYGAFRVAADGDMLLTHLVSEKFERLGPAVR
jgi:uncharacterized membrane-anchored protein